jgi:hypothetical protein
MGERRAMRYWYRNNAFRAVADTAPPGPNGLVEEYLGDAENRLIYPNVSTCTTISVLLANDTLVGTHLSAMCTAADLDLITAKMNAMAGGQAARRIAVLGVLRYVAGNNQRGGVAYTSTPAYGFPAKLETFAEKLGVSRAGICYYDQAGGTEKHYQVRALGGGDLVTYYQDVGLHRVGGGMSSKPFSPTDPWSPLATLSFMIV